MPTSRPPSRPPSGKLIEAEILHSAFGAVEATILFTTYVVELIPRRTPQYVHLDSRDGNPLPAVQAYLDGISKGLTSAISRLTEKAEETRLLRELPYVPSILHFAQVCNADCQRLLNISRRLRLIDASGSSWANFFTALRDDGLARRLRSVQGSAMFAIEGFIRHCHALHNANLKTLMSLKVDHGLSERLASLEANLVNLEEMLSRIQYLQRIEQSRVMNMHQFGRYESELSTAKSLLEQLAEETVAVNADIFDRHLAYEGSSDKFHSIIDVDDEILEWVLGLPGPGEASSVGLSNWLSWGKGVYRITGKAGSGKSTLMKFIVGHPRTEDRLDIYSSPKKVTIVSHFFARPGAPLQHSLEGLLRYLLVTVIEQHPAYGPLVLPVIQPRNDDLESSQRYVSQLESSLVGLVQEMRDLASFCFFIDGLDECDETDHEGVYRLLSELTKHQNCKVCVSSRPIPGMMDDVSGNHHLRLADRALVSNDEPPAGHLGSSDKPFGTDMEWTTMPTNAGSIFGLPKDSGLEIAESPLTGATIQIVLDELVHLFFSNLELNQLLVAATEDANIGGPRLQRNFQRLLVEFSKELRSVARDPTYKEVATVVGNFSPFLAGQIIRHVNETGPLTKHQISSSKDDTKSSKKSSTDESIASESCDDTDPDGVSMPPISHLNLHYEAPQEEPDPPSEYDGNPRASGKQQTEEKIAVTSEQAKDFLRAGTPLEKLKASLREFVTRKALDTTQDDVDSNSEGNSDDDDGFVLV